MIHQPLSTDGVHPQISSSLRLLVFLARSSGLVRHVLLFVYFFKELISLIGSRDKCHTSVFNALICGCCTNYCNHLLFKHENVKYLGKSAQTITSFSLLFRPKYIFQYYM